MKIDRSSVEAREGFREERTERAVFLPGSLGLLLVVNVSLLLSSCTVNVDVVGLAQDEARKHAKPKPESEWNQSGAWKRISDNPATYVPIDYPADSPRTEKEGTWFTDKRDGKRLFVPFVQAGPMKPGVATGEAKKITNNVKPSRISTSPGIMQTGGSMGMPFGTPFYPMP